MLQQHASVLVMGAGIQGSCIALELARQGLEVTLLDQDEVPMNRASLRNEGKIHLGLIYANDRTLETATLQLKGAMHFRYLLSRWLGSAVEQLHYSTPFMYLVAQDSLLTPEELTQHYAALQSIYTQLLADHPELDYLGQKPGRLYRRLAFNQFEQHFQIDRFIAGFETAELAIDTDQLARLLRQAIAAAPNIRFLPRRRVKAVERINGILRVEGTGVDGQWCVDARQVVNSTWESRLAIDQGLGLEPPENLLHRLKYRVIARVPEALRRSPSATMVLGRYGDVVIRPDGTAYLSWYPLGLRGWTDALSPPTSWNAPCRGVVEASDARSFAASVMAEIDTWFPGIGAAQPLLVDAGAIVAYGRTDVDDASSGLHDRTRIGVTSVNGYHTVDPGKMTTGPLFAMVAADRIIEFAAQDGLSSKGLAVEHSSLPSMAGLQS